MEWNGPNGWKESLNVPKSFLTLSAPRAACTCIFYFPTHSKERKSCRLLILLLKKPNHLVLPTVGHLGHQLNSSTACWQCSACMWPCQSFSQTQPYVDASRLLALDIIRHWLADNDRDLTEHVSDVSYGIDGQIIDRLFLSYVNTAQ